MCRNTVFQFPKIIIVVLVLVLVGGALCAPNSVLADDRGQVDWNRTSDPLLNAIGLHYGQIGGNGLSFRLPVRWFLYVQAAGGVWHTSVEQRHNFGLNLNYILRQDQHVRLFISAGAGYFYHKEEVANDGAETVTNLDTDWNVGGGVGLEYLQGRRWAWKVEADFAHLGNSGDIKVVPQVGLSYYW